MVPLYFYSFVEDEATRSVALRLIAYFAQKTGREISLAIGHPVVTHGCGELKKKAQRLIKAAKSGIDSFFLTDLDQWSTPNDLAKDWFSIECLSEVPPNFVFRVSVREVESWIMADRAAFAKFMDVAETNLPEKPDEEPDPKQTLFNLIRSKCRKKCYKEMLPLSGQHVGVAYNPMLCKFVRALWDTERAAIRSPSLNRSLSRVIAKLSLAARSSQPQ